jgi:galactonate dehydratase
VKIKQFELFLVPPRWLFLKITTDDGLFGWGEPIVEGRASTTAAAVTEVSEHLLGKDPRNVEDLWQTMYRGGFYRGGEVLMSAISGIEQALWDIKGKALGVPVYELLGGAVRDKMRVYSWIGGDNPSDVAESAKGRLAEWIDTPAQVDLAASRLAAVREVVGKEVQIGIDFHGRVHKGMAKQLFKAMEPYQPMFIEEPVLSENNEVLLELSRLSSIPIATGERMYTRWGFKELLKTGAAAKLLPWPKPLMLRLHRIVLWVRLH